MKVEKQFKSTLRIKMNFTEAKKLQKLLEVYVACFSPEIVEEFAEELLHHTREWINTRSTV